MERCQAGIDRLLALVPPAARERVEMRASSAAEVGLLLHGLEFARVRHGIAAHSFARQDEVTFGAGANETPLTDENEALCRDLLRGSSQAATPMACTPMRCSACSRSAGLSRGCARRSRAASGLARRPALHAGAGALQRRPRHAGPAHARPRGRLAVIELKADEDLHLPLQALDYWIRVRALNSDRQPAAGNAGAGRSPHSSARDTLPEQRFPCLLRACCWPLPRCAFIPPTSRYCATSRRRWSGS